MGTMTCSLNLGLRTSLNPKLGMGPVTETVCKTLTLFFSTTASELVTALRVPLLDQVGRAAPLVSMLSCPSAAYLWPSGSFPKHRSDLVSPLLKSLQLAPST